MFLPTEVIVALISVFSTLSVMLVRDIILRTINERRASRRTLLQARLRHAYVPLDHLSVMLVRTDDPDAKAQLIQDINTILRQYGHFLSEQSLSAFYTLIDDTSTGASLLQHSFYSEYAHLKDSYYRMWHSRSEDQRDYRSNQAANIHVEEVFTEATQLTHERSKRWNYF